MKKSNRRALVTGLFSFIAPGLGHMYNGKLEQGLTSFILFASIIFILIEIGVANSFSGLIIVSLLAIILDILVIVHSVRLAKENLNFIPKQYNKPIFYVIWILTLLVFVEYVTDFYRLKAYRIPTPTMEPTLLIDDHIYVDKRISDEDIKPGKVFVFKYPMNPELHYIKRCIATEGMEVNIVDKKVYVDGKLMIDSLYVQHIDTRIFGKNEVPSYFHTYGMSKYGSRDNFGPIIIPENCIFVMGDNRDNSSDSRVWGFVGKNLIVGIPLYIYLSYDSNYSLFEFSNFFRYSRFGQHIM